MPLGQWPIDDVHWNVARYMLTGKNVVDGVMKHKESAIKCNKVVGQWLAAIWVE